MAEKNVNYAPSSVREGAVPESDGTVRTNNRTRDLPTAPEHPGVLRHSALTFDPSPPLEEHKEYSLLAPNDEAELMRWHYRLGHASFKKLHLLALNGEIPKKLAKIRPLRCAGCLFGAMTKVAWHGKEQKARHSVFTATKPGGASPSTTSSRQSLASLAKPRAVSPRLATRMPPSLLTISCTSNTPTS